MSTRYLRDDLVWFVDLHKPGSLATQGVFTQDPKIVAEWASKAYPDATVVVSVRNRTRSVWQNGKIIHEWEANMRGEDDPYLNDAHIHAWKTHCSFHYANSVAAQTNETGEELPPKGC